jgi:hypothetical protein
VEEVMAMSEADQVRALLDDLSPEIGDSEVLRAFRIVLHGLNERLATIEELLRRAGVLDHEDDD